MNFAVSTHHTIITLQGNQEHAELLVIPGANSRWCNIHLVQKSLRSFISDKCIHQDMIVCVGHRTFDVGVGMFIYIFIYLFLYIFFFVFILLFLFFGSFAYENLCSKCGILGQHGDQNN